MGAPRTGEDTDDKRAIGEAIARSKAATHARVTAGRDVSIVALPGGKNRRQGSVALLDRVGWDRVELLDKSGATLDVVTAADVASSPEPIADGAPHELEIEDRRLLTMLRMVNDHCDRQMARRESEFKTILAGVTGIVTAQAAAMENLAAVYRESGDTRVDAAVERAEAADGGGALAAIAELAPHVPQLLIAARALGGKVS